MISYGDQLTREGKSVQRHTMDGNTSRDYFSLLELVCEDRYCLMCFLEVTTHSTTFIFLMVITCRLFRKYCTPQAPKNMVHLATLAVLLADGYKLETPRRNLMLVGIYSLP